MAKKSKIKKQNGSATGAKWQIKIQKLRFLFHSRLSGKAPATYVARRRSRPRHVFILFLCFTLIFQPVLVEQAFGSFTSSDFNTTSEKLVDGNLWWSFGKFRYVNLPNSSAAFLSYALAASFSLLKGRGGKINSKIKTKNEKTCPEQGRRITAQIQKRVQN